MQIIPHAFAKLFSKAQDFRRQQKPQIKSLQNRKNPKKFPLQESLLTSSSSSTLNSFLTTQRTPPQGLLFPFSNCINNPPTWKVPERSSGVKGNFQKGLFLNMRGGHTLSLSLLRRSPDGTPREQLIGGARYPLYSVLVWAAMVFCNIRTTIITIMIIIPLLLLLL